LHLQIQELDEKPAALGLENRPQLFLEHEIVEGAFAEVVDKHRAQVLWKQDIAGDPGQHIRRD
jgi:hypothetical protein